MKKLAVEGICSMYTVPAKIGGRVEYAGAPDGRVQLGTITGAADSYLKIRLDGEKRALRFHPMWMLRYLDGGME